MPGSCTVVVVGVAVGVAVGHEQDVRRVLAHFRVVPCLVREVIAAAQTGLPAGAEVVRVVRQSGDVGLHRGSRGRPAAAVVIVAVVAEVHRGEIDQVLIRAGAGVQRFDQGVQRPLRGSHAGSAAGHVVGHALRDVHDDDYVGADLFHGRILMAYDVQTDCIGAVAVVFDLFFRIRRDAFHGTLRRRRRRIAAASFRRVVDINMASVRDSHGRRGNGAVFSFRGGRERPDAVYLPDNGVRHVYGFAVFRLLVLGAGVIVSVDLDR